MNTVTQGDQGMQLRKAAKQKAKLKIGIAGASGSGKTYSALLLASGMTSWDKIAVIDSENGSADLYDNLGQYNVLPLTAPFSPERYIEAIKACEQAGMEVIIVDSISHEWEGKGGILEQHSAMPGNSFTNWAKFTPRHNRFIDSILQSTCHVICTMRSKQDTILVEKNGKQVPEKVGLKAVTREGVEYEFTLVFDINIKHQATSTKDRTGLFIDEPEFFITTETGLTLKSWAEKGIVEPMIEPVQIARIHSLLKAKAKFEKNMLESYGLEKIEHMTFAKAKGVISGLEKLADASIQ